MTAPTERSPRPVLALVGLAVALWAALPPYVGPVLNTEMRKEVADHVVPAAIMAVLFLCVLTATPKGARSTTFRFLTGLVVVLAGIWMTATHLPLVAQAKRHVVPFGTAIHHTAPAVAVLVLGISWTALHWDTEETDQARAPDEARADER